MNDLDAGYLHKLSARSREGEVGAAEEATLHVGFEGEFGSHLVSPRSLTATYITRLVCVEGIVTKCSVVRPKVSKSVHYCPTTVRAACVWGVRCGTQ